MGTMIRPELSKQHKYWIEKHRYYELKHFCLQYPLWKKAYAAIDGLSKLSHDLIVYSRSNMPGDPTGKCVELRSLYFDKMRVVEQAAFEADPDLASYILSAVTEGISYENLKSRLEIPCSKDTYYDRYRKFFWLLSRTRN